jgi:hypothetical protein
MGRTVKRLSNLEIDEISVVDAPANQHGMIAISKAQGQEDSMPSIFDADGDEVFTEELAVGDYVYDEQGNEFQVVPGDEVEEYEDEGSDDADSYEYEDEGELVGKAVLPAKLRAAGRLARMKGKEAPGAANRWALGQQIGLTRSVAPWARKASEVSGNRAVQFGAAGAAGAGGGYVGSRRSNTSKSLGDQVLEELSKAYTDDDRDKVIAKALDRVGEVSKRNELLEEAVERLVEDRDYSMFREVAKSYDLPGAEDDIAGLLQRASDSLPDADVAMLDRFFTAAGEIQKSYFEEVGLTGGRESGALDEIYGMAGEAVAKNAELGLTTEQAVTALFASNPEAYDAYEAETRTRD